MPRLAPTVRALVAPFLSLGVSLSMALPAQAQVGFRDIGWTNTTGQGSRTLQSRVYYPSSGNGRNAVITPRAGGYPTVVFLHGFLTLGREYPAVGQLFARAGYVCVLSDTARFNRTTQRQDGNALFPALVAANRGSGPFAKAIDTARIGLFGYSMGGGNTLEVLKSNPGYAAGLCIAPVAASGTDRITVPLAFIHGDGDTIVPASASASSYAGATRFAGFKFFYRFDRSGTHTNVTSLFLLNDTDRAIWARSSRVMLAFFDRSLRDDERALEQAIGADARSESRLASLSLALRTPELWARSNAQIGSDYQLGLAGEPGLGALFLSAAGARTPTPYGELFLAPAGIVFVTAGAMPNTKLLPMRLIIPNDAKLVGVDFAMQAIGQSVDRGTTNGLRLSALAPRAKVARRP